MTVDGLAERFGMPDAVLLDIEGAEQLALAGAGAYSPQGGPTSSSRCTPGAGWRSSAGPSRGCWRTSRRTDSSCSRAAWRKKCSAHSRRATRPCGATSTSWPGRAADWRWAAAAATPPIWFSDTPAKSWRSTEPPGTLGDTGARTRSSDAGESPCRPPPPIPSPTRPTEHSRIGPCRGPGSPLPAATPPRLEGDTGDRFRRGRQSGPDAGRVPRTELQQSLKCLVVTLAALTLSMVAQAQVHLQIPEDRQPPFYATSIENSCPTRRSGRS